MSTSLFLPDQIPKIEHTGNLSMHGTPIALRTPTTIHYRNVLSSWVHITAPCKALLDRAHLLLLGGS